MLAKQAVDRPDRDAAPSVDPAEVEQFDAIAEEWWNPDGPVRPLHRLTPIRLAYLRDRIGDHFGRDVGAERPFAGLSGVDIGCGGGLVSEPLARLGLAVTGVDPGANNIASARAHAAGQDLAIDYRAGTPEDLAAAGNRYDVVLALEIVEHVADRRAFIGTCAELARPGGLLIVSTINRTAKAFVLAIVGAEYVLRWLPRGTHDWQRFITPDELAALLRGAGLEPVDARGFVFDPLGWSWRLSARDLSVNYVTASLRPAA
jgi:2-polyprenyl-6-hydroxyphenyl methylase/3-demethylubiquinone-9 3-methyltransferase